MVNAVLTQTCFRLESCVFFLSVLTIFNSGVVSQDVNRITLEDGEFKNVLVAIDEGVQEDPAIIQNIKVCIYWSSYTVVWKKKIFKYIVEGFFLIFKFHLTAKKHVYACQ